MISEINGSSANFAGDFGVGPMSSTSVGAYIGDPTAYVRRAVGLDQDWLIRQVELAEGALIFRGKSAASVEHSFARVLALRPAELPLHHRVWRLLISMGRRSEAMASYRAACARVSCEPTVAAYHACLLTTAGLYAPREGTAPRTAPTLPPRRVGNIPTGADDGPSTADATTAAATTAAGLTSLFATGGTRARHVARLTTPRPPTAAELGLSLPDHGRPYYAFNPAIIAWPPTHHAHGGGDDGGGAHGGGQQQQQRRRRRQQQQQPAGGGTAAGWRVFFRYSNVRSVWDAHAGAR